MICINCGNEIANPAVNCPHCGYRFTVDTNMYCPNLEGLKCPFTGERCTKGTAFALCPVKQKADRESII